MDETRISPLLTAEELAPILKLASKTVYRMARRGDLPGHWFGRQVRFDLQEVLKATAPGSESRIQAMAKADVARALLAGRPRRARRRRAQ